MEHKGLLSGMKVLDLSRVLAAPYCGMMLADLGAEVIKIERPGKGDDARSNFPIVNGESAYYMNLNRNKRGIVLNLKSQAGKEVFRKLVAQSDVVLENYRPGVMDRLGLGYEELRKINPAIIYASVSGFGHYGPYHERAGYDIVGQAISGLMSTTGWPDSAPTRTGTAIADVMGGISCCVGILAAYINRLKTGEGEKVDVALVDSMVSSLEIINIIYLATGKIPQRIGNRYEALYPYDSFQAKDGMLVIGAGNDKLYGLLCDLMGKPELKTDPRFTSNNDRVLHHADLKPIIEAEGLDHRRRGAGHAGQGDSCRAHQHHRPGGEGSPYRRRPRDVRGGRPPQGRPYEAHRQPDQAHQPQDRHLHTGPAAGPAQQRGVYGEAGPYGRRGRGPHCIRRRKRLMNPPCPLPVTARRIIGGTGHGENCSFRLIICNTS